LHEYPGSMPDMDFSGLPDPVMFQQFRDATDY
jgi:hypothetical protein